MFCFSHDYRQGSFIIDNHVTEKYIDGSYEKENIKIVLMGLNQSNVLSLHGNELLHKDFSISFHVPKISLYIGFRVQTCPLNFAETNFSCRNHTTHLISTFEYLSMSPLNCFLLPSLSSHSL